MKLAEALILRADCQKRIAQLKSRLLVNAKVQEGDAPAETPQELISELERTSSELLDLIKRINRTNSATAFAGPGQSRTRLQSVMFGIERTRYDDLITRLKQSDFVTPTVIHRGGPLSIEVAMNKLDTYGFHGASDPVEGAVWRVERNELTNPGKNSDRKSIVDFLVKYVRPDKEDGIYLPEISGRKPVWNWR